MVYSFIFENVHPLTYRVNYKLLCVNNSILCEFLSLFFAISVEDCSLYEGSLQLLSVLQQ